MANKLEPPRIVQVTAVHDGDSYRVVDTVAGLRYWIRIFGPDSPEVFAPGYSVEQPFGLEVAKQVRETLKHQFIEIEVFEKRDQWGRRVAKVATGSAFTEDFAEYLVENGLAWAPTGISEYAKHLQVLQKGARLAKMGLWGQPGRKIRPSVWRAMNMENIKRNTETPFDWSDEPLH